jgi:hypothetical protein
LTTSTNILYDNTKKVPLLWELTVLLYLLRSIADPLKYLFIISFGILLIYYLYRFFSDPGNTRIIKYLIVTKEFHILGIFFFAGIMLSNRTEILSVKSLTNYLAIAFLYLVYFEIKEEIRLISLFRKWIIFTMAIGIFSILKWFNFIFGLELGIFSPFYEPGTSLVAEYNLFATYFVLSLLVYAYGLYTEKIQKKFIFNQVILLSLIFIIAMTGSRRGIIFLTIITLVGIIVLLLRGKKRTGQFYRNLAFLYILLLCFSIIIAALFPFRSKLIRKESSRKNIATSLYRYSTIFNPNSTFSVFYEKLWPVTSDYYNDVSDWDKYATYNNTVDGAVSNKYIDLKNEYWLDLKNEDNSQNIFYNGDFKLGARFWRIYAKAHIAHEVIQTEYGNAIRVSRTDGSGNWPLEYNGREIVYYKGVTYTFSFKYRVIKGMGVPFKIGWWIDEGDGLINDLEYTTKPLGDGWFEYIASYTFKNDQRNLLTFMNHQIKNTIIDFTDIELTCNDTLNRPYYLDQVLQADGKNLYYNSNFVHGLKFWGSVTQDSIDHSIVDTRFGKAIRVSRKDGKGMWPLVYLGREIYYYKDLTYYFRFKFRVLEGTGIPFKIGWRALEESPIPYNLHKDIFPIEDEWFECIASYQFSKDQYGEILAFLNNQLANTTVDLADIELLCNDTSNLPMYSDEMIEVIKSKNKQELDQQMGLEHEKLLSKRLDRWNYALKIWSEYPWYNKLIGDGFDYLTRFGRKFYPNETRTDYPHNPIVSSFLYSGIIGGLFYIYFLSISIWFYWKYRRHHMLLFISFILCLVFLMISGDNHFSVPIFAMLSLVPFITKNNIREKDLKIRN